MQIIIDNILIKNKTFNQQNTFNPESEDNKTDGLSVLRFSENLHVTVNDCVIDGEVARWGGKMSKNFFVEYNNCIFKNGTARSFDMVRGGAITFNNCKFINEGVRPKIKSPYFSFNEVCDIGMKGGVRDVRFNNCQFNDILIGDYSIYDQIDRPKARRFRFSNCRNLDGGPIIIRGRYVEEDSIQLIDTEAKMFIWPNWMTKIYWWYNRKFGDTRKPDGWNVIDDRERI